MSSKQASPSMHTGSDGVELQVTTLPVNSLALWELHLASASTGAHTSCRLSNFRHLWECMYICDSLCINHPFGTFSSKMTFWHCWEADHDGTALGLMLRGYMHWFWETSIYCVCVTPPHTACCIVSWPRTCMHGKTLGYNNGGRAWLLFRGQLYNAHVTWLANEHGLSIWCKSD